ncbi:ABC transporter ATP-binding protein (plasmid) [Azospirillum brasilense]|uniref:ABC transporter ATP-binding protein n=1 Tax=Azospirillum brasilense TaxID=192 RepID=A0A4D8R6P8_AZOBR|nr:MULTISPECIES: ABC transporter ATP-binding protein [Azospirillum]MDW7555482.1 ABC transporter ATP-binding protein [Azospirillum brasilense]MDW7595110.1 ABC transporter ATP-binding protein [Azospirillum brasilense]MDW7630263.1 ABC transporter ATP-binding protein [Azospirillum brasilense]MDX5949631.1 ABC transporter ATP-binding protein [Azospirillum brasilense]OPH12207.1 ABC transporter ATP-binding protein [Azospirillum brasilense]
MTDTPTIRVEGVSKRYGDAFAVREVDLDLAAGECVAMVGHNGAGKSSLIKLMLGLTTPTAGSVRVLGGDPASAAASHIRRQVGFLPESVAFHPSMTGRETLDFYARLKRVPRDGNDALFERVGLEPAAVKRRVGTYSKGMRQRLALAQALLGGPKVLFLDEPTTGLDPALRQSFYEIVRSLRDAGTTVLLCSHALTELEGQADRVVVMNRGRKVADGSLATLRGLAQLPVRIRLTLPSGEVVETACANDDKVATLRQIACEGPELADIEVVQPSLDEMYAHFLRREAAE